MDHPAGRACPEERLPGGRLSPDRASPERALLRKVPSLAFGHGEDITLGGALASALLTTGDERRRVYDDAIAGSGIAFQLRIDDRWDPATVSPNDPAVIRLAAESVGLRIDAVPRPWDAEMQELLWERTVESIDAGMPVLVRGFKGLEEFGLVIGYDRKNRLVFARTYFDREDPEPDALFDDDKEDILPVFLDPITPPAETELGRRALGRAAAVSATATTERESVHLFQGDAAFAAWIAALDEAATGKEATQRAFVDHARRVFLADARRTAARFLRRVRRDFPDRVGADLVRAAEAYGHVADECEKHGVQPFDASVVARFLDPGQRRGWAHALERARTHDRDAVGALAAAAAALGGIPLPSH